MQYPLHASCLSSRLLRYHNERLDMRYTLTFSYSLFPLRDIQLDGSMAGDVGFDPLGLSSIAGLAGADLYWMREAELKHCRIAMLAVVGVLFCDQIGSFPGFPSGSNQMQLFWQVWAEKPQYVAAGFIFCGIIESEFSTRIRRFFVCRWRKSRTGIGAAFPF